MCLGRGNFFGVKIVNVRTYKREKSECEKDNAEDAEGAEAAEVRTRDSQDVDCGGREENSVWRYSAKKRGTIGVL